MKLKTRKALSKIAVLAAIGVSMAGCANLPPLKDITPVTHNTPIKGDVGYIKWASGMEEMSSPQNGGKQGQCPICVPMATMKYDAISADKVPSLSLKERKAHQFWNDYLPLPYVAWKIKRLYLTVPDPSRPGKLKAQERKIDKDVQGKTVVKYLALAPGYYMLKYGCQIRFGYPFPSAENHYGNAGIASSKRNNYTPIHVMKGKTTLMVGYLARGDKGTFQCAVTAFKPGENGGGSG